MIPIVATRIKLRPLHAQLLKLCRQAKPPLTWCVGYAKSVLANLNDSSSLYAFHTLFRKHSVDLPARTIHIMTLQEGPLDVRCSPSPFLWGNRLKNDAQGI